MWSWTQTSGARGIGSLLVRAAVSRREMGSRTVDLTSRPSRVEAEQALVALGFEPPRDKRLPIQRAPDRLICGARDTIMALACDLVPDVQHLGHLWIRCRDQRKEVVQLHKRFGTLEVAGR